MYKRIFVIQEIIAYKGYHDKHDIISYWHTYDQKEVDIVIGDAKVAIEIKSTEHVETKHKKGLKAFNEEHPDCRLMNAWNTTTLYKIRLSVKSKKRKNKVSYSIIPSN